MFALRTIYRWIGIVIVGYVCDARPVAPNEVEE
jgi:hypothetical protein